MSTFLQKLSSLLGTDGDTAKKLLDDSDMSELVELSAAVNDHDKKTALDIMHKIQAKGNFFIGEPVTINGDKATVVAPDEPGNTVKISRQGSVEMVKKDELEKIDETDENTSNKNFKLKWKISEKPKGRYKSFQKTHWPTASYEDGKAAIIISCENDYSIQTAKSGKHDPLNVYVADWSARDNDPNAGAFNWRKLKATFTNLEDAKKAGIEILKKNPNFLPKKKIDEAVLGMTSIPGLDRIKTLAGIKPQGSVGAGETNDTTNPNNTSNNNGQIKSFNQQSDIRKQAEKEANEKIDVNNLPNDVTKLKQMVMQNQETNEEAEYFDMNNEDDVTETCLEALNKLEENINNLRISDLSEVRSRILQIYNHLNETISYTGRKKKN